MTKNEVLTWLERKGTRRTVEGMARYGIAAKKAFGVPMGTLLTLRKRLGMDHALSLALWDSGCLALSERAAPRWVGKDALRELARARVRSRLAPRAQ